ncbi:zinc finger, RAN binding protein, putative [Plasmodium malariae]|uniref:Zinc finger Ran-binding domain-containing protein 2 n=3 Tax=Plasmodium (Plasmodium) TaxID=418103 RepID=A0A1D3JIE2_PLAMA|nr:zinc finger, RAN binding protein, putative [Plasmodium malariae]SBT86231.1 zinc finger, RAN binding protein, putative [Plasmodium malariae]
MENHKHIDKMQTGDWTCSDENCRNVNFSKRTHCNRCNRVRPKCSIKKNFKQVFFKSNDWKCDDCGNINWAKREKCNICGKSRFTKKLSEFKSNKEVRTGKGGGHYDIQGSNEKRVHDSEDEEYDEFGRKKKRKIIENGDKNANINFEESDVRHSSYHINNKDNTIYKNITYKNKHFENPRSRSVSSNCVKRSNGVGDSKKYYDRKADYEKKGDRSYNSGDRYDGGKHSEGRYNDGRYIDGKRSDSRYNERRNQDRADFYENRSNERRGDYDRKKYRKD